MIVLYIPYDTLHLLSLFVYVSFKRLELVGATYIGGIRSRSERSQISRPLPDDLVIPVHFEVDQEFRLRFERITMPKRGGVNWAFLKINNI